MPNALCALVSAETPVADAPFNIVNVRDMDSAAENFAARVRREEGRLWCRTTLRKFLSRERTLVSSITAEELKARLDSDEPLPDWLIRALAERRTLHWFRTGFDALSPAGAEVVQSLYHVIDWLNALPQCDRHWRRLARMSVPDAIGCAALWHRQLAKRREADPTEDLSGIEPVTRFGDGVQFVRVHSAEALAREGRLMRHCVTTYYPEVRAGKSEIYSLRDAQNQPHVTLEVVQGAIRQIKGTANSVPSKTWLRYVAPFVRQNAWQAGSHLARLGLIDPGGRLYVDTGELIHDLPRVIAPDSPAFSWTALAPLMRLFAGDGDPSSRLTADEQRRLIGILEAEVSGGRCYRVTSCKETIATVAGSVMEARFELAGTVLILAEMGLLLRVRQRVRDLCNSIGDVVLHAVLRRPEILYRLSLAAGAPPMSDGVERFFKTGGLYNEYREVRRAALVRKREHVSGIVLSLRRRLADRRAREAMTELQRVNARKLINVYAPYFSQRVLRESDVM